MALSATGRTLRIRRQMQSYADSPMSDEGGAGDVDDQQQPAGQQRLKLKKSKITLGSMLVRVRLDGPTDNFASASVVTNHLPQDLVPDFGDAEDFSSDDEILKDVRAYVRQTLGKQALVKVEAGLCGGDDPTVGATGVDNTRSGTPWQGESGGLYITVRHPSPDAPIDTPPLPGLADGLVQAPAVGGNVTAQLPLTCRHWFHPDWVSDIERAELSTFGVTEGTYKEVRDRIVDAYNTDPSKFLSIRNAREATGYAEVGVLTKVWAFLDYWGIINYLADPSSVPRFSKKLVDYPFGRPQTAIREIVCSVCRKPCNFAAYVLKPDAAPLVPKEQVSAARFCTNCYQTGAYPPFFNETSFDLIDVHLPGVVTADFTEEESMRMLEAIDRYGTDWEAVAEMVGGGKTSAQCLLHFTQIPIVDKLITGEAPEKSVRPSRNPFRNPTNPVIDILTLLSAGVPADVAAEVCKLVKSIDAKEDMDVDMGKQSSPSHSIVKPEA